MSYYWKYCGWQYHPNKLPCKLSKENGKILSFFSVENNLLDEEQKLPWLVWLSGSSASMQTKGSEV